MRKLADNDYLTMVSRLVLGIVFIYAAIPKILDPGLFAKSIWYYHLMPGSLINLMALIMPWLELVCALGLIAGLFYRGSSWLVTLMMTVFMVALSTTIVRGLDIDCGCFKVGMTATGTAWIALLRDIPLLLLSLQLLLSRSTRWMLSKN